MKKTLAEKGLDEYTYDEFVAWAKGYLLLSIGKGEFGDAVWLVVNQCAMNRVFGGQKNERKK